MIRQKLLSKRLRLIQEGKPTLEVVNILQEIFLMYSESPENLTISSSMAYRLWYRCGLRISSLTDIIIQKESVITEVHFEDFLGVVCQVISADVAESNVSEINTCLRESFCEVRFNKSSWDFICEKLTCIRRVR